MIFYCIVCPDRIYTNLLINFFVGYLVMYLLISNQKIYQAVTLSYCNGYHESLEYYVFFQLTRSSTLFSLKKMRGKIFTFLVKTLSVQPICFHRFDEHG